MNLISFLLWTWSLLCLLLLVSSIWGSWFSQEKVSINRSNILNLLFFSFTLGTAFFSLNYKYYLWALVFLIASGYSLFPLIKDLISLYTKEVWSLSVNQIKRVISYYNPRLYWLAISLFLGITILLWQPLDAFLSWEVLVGVFISYYVGILGLSPQIKKYNALVDGILENDWGDYEQTAPVFGYGEIINFRIQGIQAWDRIEDIYVELYAISPEEVRAKLVLCKSFYENPQEFIEKIVKDKQLLACFDAQELHIILEKLITNFAFFDLVWESLPEIDKAKENLIWLKIHKEHNAGNFSAIEKLISKVPWSENISELIEEIRFFKIEKLKEFSYISSSVLDYEVNEEDYLRTAAKDKLFVKKYKMDLYEIFNNSCVKTGIKEDIELDHFFVPKSKGGTFLMKRKDGIWVINAIILNKKYNIIKGNKKIEEFFSIEELERINFKLKQLSIKVNYELWGSD